MTQKRVIRQTLRNQHNVLLWPRRLQNTKHHQKEYWKQSRKLNPSHPWKHGLPTPGVMSIIWSLQVKKTENWHGDNQRRAIKWDKELLYENRLRNSIIQFGKTKTLREYTRVSKCNVFSQQECRVYPQHFKQSNLRVLEKNSMINKYSRFITSEDATGHKKK